MRSTQLYAVNRTSRPDSLELRSADVPDPGPGEVRLQVEAAGVSYGDLLFQRGVVPGGPKPPYVPGCDLTGVVERVGAGVAGLLPGQRCVALVRSGGFSSAQNVPAGRVVPVPDGLDPVPVAAAALNYFIAYQMLHRVARIGPRRRILVHGAAGGVGLALIQLAELIGGVKVWGTCSADDADLVRRHGAIPIDYRKDDFVATIEAAGDRLDAVFDFIGGSHFLRSYRVLGRGGRLVAYGQNAALRDGKRLPAVGAVGFLGGIALPKLLPDGRSTGFYNAWFLEKRIPNAYRDDLNEVLSLLVADKVAPRSVTVLPLSEATQVFRMLEDGVKGKLVLDCTA